LPCAVSHERAGTTTNIEGRVSRLGPKLSAPGFAWPDWMIAAELAAALGSDLRLASDNDLSDELARTAPAYAGLTQQVLHSDVAHDGILVPLTGNEDHRDDVSPIDPVALPGVESAACLTSVPSGWNWNWTEFNAEGAAPAPDGDKPFGISQIVTPEFFSVLRVPLKQGRLLSDQDTSGAAPVAVVSESMARRAWPDQNPLGKRVRLGRPEDGQPFRTIVGVVGDVKPNAMDHDPSPTAYVPFEQQPEAASAIVVRTSGDPLTLASLVSKQILSLDPEQPAYDLRSVDQVVSDGLSGIELASHMMLIFALCALLLAAAGIFAVTAYSVTQRTHEIGVRVALGAQRFDVLRLVVGGAMKTAAIGLGIGVALAVLLTRAVSSALFGVVQFDTITIGLLTLALASVAALAAYVPARRAAKVDPMVALRYE